MNLDKKITICSVFAGGILGGMHIINKFIYHTATMYNILDHENKKYYDWKYGRIFYTKQGSGKPILLVHDLNVYSSSYEWNNIKDLLSKTNTVYTIDLLGCGCSDKPNLIYTNYLYVQLISDFIKDIIGEKTDIITAGSSASIILMACVNNNTNIDQILLVNPENLLTQSKIPNRWTKLYRYIICTPIIGTFIYNLLTNKKAITENLQLNYYNNNKMTEQHIISCFESSHRNDTKSRYLYASIKSRFTNINIINGLKKLNNNIFIIIGNANPENELTANQYQNILSSIKIAAVEDTKNMPQIEEPEKFIKNVKILFDI